MKVYEGIFSHYCSGIFPQNQHHNRDVSDTSDEEIFKKKKSKKKKRKNKRPTAGDETVAKKSKGQL